jgi:hypothetical protein
MKRKVHKKASQSKEFEELAARLETALAPEGAQVKSPDRIRDQFTGQYREVDASIRYTIGSSDILITVECRDRVRTQDVTWIEQLATKRVHVRADRTLAVSSSPFTEAALLAAKTHGISTRLISEVTDEEIRSAVNTLEVAIHSTDIAIRQLQLHYVEHIEPSPSLDPVALKAWNAGGWDAKIFRVGDSPDQSSLDDLIKVASEATSAPAKQTPQASPQPRQDQAKGTNLLLPHLSDVSSDGTTVERDLALTFEDETVLVLTSIGWKQLQAVSIKLAVSRSKQEIPAARIGSYAAEDRLITNFTEHKIEWKPGETLRVLSYPTPPQGKR